MAETIRIGIVGCDTSHVTAFTKLLHDQSDPHHVAGATVVAAYPSFSDDMEKSKSRVEGFKKELQEKWQVKMCDSIGELVEQVDAILLESVDGRRHLPELRQIVPAGKPVFIDKPFAASLADAKEMVRLLTSSGVPAWSSSSLRYEPNLEAFLAAESHGKVVGADTYGPAALDPTNPGWYWYGIHAVEMLYRILGPGCAEVRCYSTDGCDVAIGQWADGRVGVVRGIRQGHSDFGATIYCENAIGTTTRNRDIALYAPLIQKIMEFFRTGVAPVPLEETLEIMAFIEAALESSKADGKPAKIDTSV